MLMLLSHHVHSMQSLVKKTRKKKTFYGTAEYNSTSARYVLCSEVAIMSQQHQVHPPSTHLPEFVW